MSNQAPGLTEYEKSEYLTRAQKAIVIALYNGTLGNPFESTEEVSDYLAPLVAQATLDTPVADETRKLDANSVVFALPSDLLFRTFEKCTITTTDCGDADAAVIPVTQDEYWRTVRNPFKKQNGRKVLRLAFADTTLSSGSVSETGYSELVSAFPIKSYTVRYMKKPEPIILETLTGGLTIEGCTSAKPCMLHENLHNFILAEAVKQAKEVWKA